MNDPETILGWLKEAGAHVFRTEAPARARGFDVTPSEDFFIEILINEGTVGVRATKGDRQEYQCLVWRELEEAESNPLLPLIDALAALVRKG